MIYTDSLPSVKIKFILKQIVENILTFINFTDFLGMLPIRLNAHF
jgi:hypothetical protein